MKICAGYDIAFECFEEVPMVLLLSVHPSRQPDLLTDHIIRFSPEVNARAYLDKFGNICTRLVGSPGLIEIRNEFLIRESGLADEVAPDAVQIPLDELPNDALVYLLQPILRYREAVRNRLESVRPHHRRLATRASNLWLCPRPC